MADSLYRVCISRPVTIFPRRSHFITRFPSTAKIKINPVRANKPESENRKSHNGTPKSNIFSSALQIPQLVWQSTIKPLSDFGFSRRSIWEGYVGVFLLTGTILLVWSLAWLRGFQLRSKFKKYTAVFEFSQACGIAVGTPVRIRGVKVGRVVGVDSSLRSIEAAAEVEDEKTIIPRNSLVEVNQSGLLMETMIDITPRDPIPETAIGPHDEECPEQGLIICDRQKIKGYQGVSLDTMIGIFIRIGREMEKVGVSNTYSLAERVASVIEEGRPLLKKIKAMTEDIQPLLADVRDRNMVKEVDTLAKNVTRTLEDLRKTQTSIVTPENTELIQKSIYSLVYTLKNIENISSDVHSFTGDEATRKNLKVLIKSLSRFL